jgi:hypothetical protein
MKTLGYNANLFYLLAFETFFPVDFFKDPMIILLEQDKKVTVEPLNP